MKKINRKMQTCKAVADGASKVEQKQASMETLHQDLQEIIRLLRDIQRNQFAFYAAEHYQMTPRADEELYKLVCNGLKPFGFDPKGD